ARRAQAAHGLESGGPGVAGAVLAAGSPPPPRGLAPRAPLRVSARTHARTRDAGGGARRPRHDLADGPPRSPVRLGATRHYSTPPAARIATTPPPTTTIPTPAPIAAAATGESLSFGVAAASSSRRRAAEAGGSRPAARPEACPTGEITGPRGAEVEQSPAAAAPAHSGAATSSAVGGRPRSYCAQRSSSANAYIES